MTMSVNTEYLNALARVCEAAPRIQIPVTSHIQASYLRPAMMPSYNSGYVYNAVPFDMERRESVAIPPPVVSYAQDPYHPAYTASFPSPHLPVPLTYSQPAAAVHTTSLLPLMSPPVPLTPPPTPDSSFSTQLLPSYPQQTPPLNPVLKNVVAYAKFQQFLDESWPQDSLRRGSAVIRASLYTKIADALRGRETTARFKHWVKKSEFFVIEKMQPGVGYGACLAVPVVKSRASSKKMICKSPRHSSYKLVARMEDFAHVIGAYHNDQKGHHGIRRTYALQDDFSQIQEDFSYLPRVAVSKFIELCDICSIHRGKGSVLRPAQDKDTATDGERKKATQRKPKTKATTDTSETEETAVVDGIAPKSPISSLPTPTTASESKTIQSESPEDDSSGACNKENVEVVKV